MQNKQFSKDEVAQVGIGTMIVFIATILVAAVAAGVLIDTSQKLQGKATQTGNAATEQVGTALEFQAIYGKLDTVGTNLLRLEMWVDTAAGSDAIDLSKLIVQYKTSAATKTFVYVDGNLATPCGTPCATGFEEFALYQQDGATLAGLDWVLIPGERNMIQIGLNADGDGASLDLPASTKATIELLPEIGINAKALINTPATFESKKVFELF